MGKLLHNAKTLATHDLALPTGAPSKTHVIPSLLKKRTHLPVTGTRPDALASHSAELRN